MSISQTTEKATHSPGPFHVTEDAETNIRDFGGRLIGRVFEVYSRERDPERPDFNRKEVGARAANGALFAAAPELLEALKWLTEMAGYAVWHLEPEWAQTGGPGDSNKSDLHHAIEQARTAIEQAEEGVRS